MTTRASGPERERSPKEGLPAEPEGKREALHIYIFNVGAGPGVYPDRSHSCLLQVHWYLSGPIQNLEHHVLTKPVSSVSHCRRASEEAVTASRRSSAAATSDPGPGR